MENRSKADVTTRASFSTSSPDSNVERSSPPSKIRRTSASVSTSSAIPKSTPQSVLDCSMNFCGFGPSEFLPIVGRKYRVPETLDPRISDTLCDDALGHCLFSGFLNSFETVRLSSISKRFRTIASYQVNRLDLSRCPDLRADDLMSIVGRFPNLKDLNFDYCKQFRDQHLTALLPLSETIESLSLKGCNIDDSHLCSFLETLAKQNGGSTHLTLLDVSAVDEDGSLRVGDESVKAVSIHCPRLKSLRLGWCKNVTDLSLETIATSRLSVLEMLDLSLTGITDDSIQNLEHALFSIPTLTHLDLSATQLTGTRFLTALARHRNTSELPLRELSFQFMQELTMESLEEFLDSKSFRRLQILDLNFSEVSNPKTTSHDIQGAVTRAMERNRRLHERGSCWGRDT